jgi:hypothetical protein
MAKTQNAADIQLLRLLEVDGRIVVRVYFKEGHFFDVKSDANQAYVLATDGLKVLTRRYCDKSPVKLFGA